MYSKKFNKQFNKLSNKINQNSKCINDSNEPFIKLYQSLLDNSNLNPTELLLLSTVYDRLKLSVNHGSEFFDKKSLSHYILTSRDYLSSRVHVSKATITRTLSKLRNQGYLKTKQLFNGGLKIFAPYFKYQKVQPINSKSSIISNHSNPKKAIKNSTQVPKKKTKSVFSIQKDIQPKPKSKQPSYLKMNKKQMEQARFNEIQKDSNYYCYHYIDKIQKALLPKIKKHPENYHLSAFDTPYTKAAKLGLKKTKLLLHKTEHQINAKWEKRMQGLTDNDVMSEVQSQSDKMSSPRKSICSGSHSEPNQSYTSTIKTTNAKRSTIRKPHSLKRKRFSYPSHHSLNIDNSLGNPKQARNTSLTPLIAVNYRKLRNKKKKTAKERHLIIINSLRLQELVDNQIKHISVPKNAVKSLKFFSQGSPDVFKRYVGVLYESKFIARKELHKKLKPKLTSKSKWQEFYHAFRFETNMYYRGAKHSLARALENMLTVCTSVGRRGVWKRYYLGCMINYFIRAGKTYLSHHGLEL